MTLANLDWLLGIDLDPAAWLYVAFVGAYLPIGATRARARLAKSTDAPGRAFRKNAAGAQLVMLTLALALAWTHHIRMLQLPAAAWQWLLVPTAVATVELLRWMVWKSLTIEQRRALWVRTILPSRAELPEWTLLTLLASVSEEIAYRGLLFAVLAAATGSLVVSSLLCAVSFGAAHAPQGARSQILIGTLGLVFQVLVIVTGSLLPAMAVHAIANLIAGIRGDKRFRDLDAAQQVA
ncbi:MAG TPA: CPBP family intramembrane glutamic endopeptidase [Vicinamibacterales bacterium]